MHETGEQLCGRRHGQNGCSESGQRMKDCGNCSARSDGQLMSKVSVMDQRDVIEYPAYRHRASAAVRQRLWPPERLDTAVLMRWLLSPATNCQPARGFCHTIDSQLLPQSSNNEVLLHVSLLNIFMSHRYAITTKLFLQTKWDGFHTITVSFSISCILYLILSLPFTIPYRHFGH